MKPQGVKTDVQFNLLRRHFFSQGSCGFSGRELGADSDKVEKMVRGRLNSVPPTEVHLHIPSTCEYTTPRGKRKFADVL